MGRVQRLPMQASGVRPADAARIHVATITVRNTRAMYAAVLDRLVTGFGTDTDVALLDREPDRVSGWFTFVWGGKSAKTFDIRLAALASACGYRRAQGLLVGDPLVRLRLRARPARLFYRRAAELFEAHTARYDCGPYPLHGHTSVRGLAEYARVSGEGLRRYRANNDPAVRRLRRR